MDLIGCDLSAQMLKRLQEKYPAARIAQADASRLRYRASRTAVNGSVSYQWRNGVQVFCDVFNIFIEPLSHGIDQRIFAS